MWSDIGKEAWKSVECTYPDSFDCSLMWDLNDFPFDNAGKCIYRVIYNFFRDATRHSWITFAVCVLNLLKQF